MIAKERCTQPLQNHFLLHWNICIFFPGSRVDYEVNNSIFFHKLIDEFHPLLHSPTKHLNSFNNSRISNCVRREINYFKAPPKFFFCQRKNRQTNLNKSCPHLASSLLHKTDLGLIISFLMRTDKTDNSCLLLQVRIYSTRQF